MLNLLLQPIITFPPYLIGWLRVKNKSDLQDSEVQIIMFLIAFLSAMLVFY
jgi:hypothetical protein